MAIVPMVPLVVCLSNEKVVTHTSECLYFKSFLRCCTRVLVSRPHTNGMFSFFLLPGWLHFPVPPTSCRTLSPHHSTTTRLQPSSRAQYTCTYHGTCVLYHVVPSTLAVVALDLRQTVRLSSYLARSWRTKSSMGCAEPASPASSEPSHTSRVAHQSWARKSQEKTTAVTWVDR